MKLPRLTVLVLLFLGAAVAAPAQTGSGVDRLVERLRAALAAADQAAFLELVHPAGDHDKASAFAERAIAREAGQITVRERDRAPIRDAPHAGTIRVVLDVFTEVGARGRIDTWQIDAVPDIAGRERAGDPAGDDALEWLIADQGVVSSIEGLYRLSLNPGKQFEARNLVISGEDLELRLPRGSVFVSETENGVTGAVLLGKGRMVFSPRPAAERTQVRIFSGREELDTEFSAVFVRLNPIDFEARFSGGALEARTVNARALRRAQEVFDEELPKSYGLDLSDLSRDAWSLTPGFGDLLAEIHTRKYGTLTYARSSGEAEDLTLFDREKRRNIAVYASEQKLAARGRFYSETDLTDYDVQHYDIDLQFSPLREWLEGRTTMRVRVRAFMLNALTIRLAEALTVRSVVSASHGRLLAVRVRNQDSFIVNLPSPAARGDEIELTVAYGGRLLPPPPDREALVPQQHPFARDLPSLTPEPRFVYSNRSYWHPQATVSDYATARIRLTVPVEYDCVASGEAAAGNPVLLPEQEGVERRKVFVFSAGQPVRYLAFAVSRFRTVAEGRVTLDAPPAGALRDGPGRRDGATYYDALAVRVEANPRHEDAGSDLQTRVQDVLGFYASLIGDLPYPAFTLAVVDNEVPGGHSPGYFALLHQPLPTTPYVWRNDPVVFDDFREFFLAHEVAHQFWGQAVGWKNYHEQWLSEGFAQYFAALYAEHRGGPRVFADVLRKMRRTALEYQDQGPVYLGYRLGHVKGRGQVFRALVYNKGALVLHMLRGLVGDESFFEGLRDFYHTWRFRKAGTEDFREAMETASGLTLNRFFERWIYESGIPEIRFSYERRVGPFTDTAASHPSEICSPDLEGPHIVVRFEHDEPVDYDLPVTLTLRYRSGESDVVVVPVSSRLTEYRIPLRDELRDVRVDEHSALAEIKQ